MVDPQEKVDKVDLKLDLQLEKISVHYLSLNAIYFIQELIKALKVAEEKDDTASQYLSFEWSFEAKEVAILLRDASLNVLKLHYYHRDGLRSDSDVQAFNDELVSLLNRASNELRIDYNNYNTTSLEVDPKWLHQTKPVSKIIEQLETIIDQIKKIQRSQNKLDSIEVRLQDFRSQHDSYIGERHDIIDKVKSTILGLKQEADKLAAKVDKIGVQKLVALIDKKIENIDTRPIMSSYEDIRLDDIEKLSLPIGTDSGMIITKNVDILSEVSSWISFNLASRLKDADKKIIGFYEQASISLFQLSNRLKAKIIDEESEVNVFKSDYLTPLEKLEDLSAGLQKDVIESNLTNVALELNKNFIISQLFNTKYSFLPQSAGAQVMSASLTAQISERYSKEAWINTWNNFVATIIPKSTREYPQDTTDFVKMMTQFNPVSDMNTLFMRKGFLGTSFTVAREGIESSMQKHFEKWREGFGGGLMIQGPTGCGKSNLIGKLQLLLEDLPSYSVIPNQSIDVRGHKFLIPHDLITAVKTIVKYQDISKCIVIIDDLESYLNGPENAYDVIDQLIDLIRRYSHRIYFIVAVNDRLSDKMSQFFDIDNVFTKVVNAAKITDQTIKDALVTRALAVANHEDNNYNGDSFYNNANIATNICEGNIGYAMQLWCIINSGMMGYRMPSEFEDSVLRHRHLLKTLMTFGAIKAYDVLQMYDEVQQQKVRSDIAYLLQTKIVERPTEGFLSINRLLRYPIDKILNS